MARNDGILNIFLALRSSLARVVMRIVPPKEVEDIVQETYVRVCQIDKYSADIGEPRALLYKVARNLALDHVKRAEYRLVSSTEDLNLPERDEVDACIDQTFEQAASDEEFSQFCKAVRHLPKKCRRVFVLKKVYGFSQREIARILDISESTVEKQVAEGIKRCTSLMQQQQTGGHNNDNKRAACVDMTAARGTRHE